MKASLTHGGGGGRGMVRLDMGQMGKIKASIKVCVKYKEEVILTFLTWLER